MYRGRFAPTPSGDLHLGSLVTALASFLDARVANGEWLLRIENIDVHRCKPAFEDNIKCELERHGLHWDGPVVRQSERLEYYWQALNQLNQNGRIYVCRCSKSKLMRSGCVRNDEGEFVYPGFCRTLHPGPAPADFLKGACSVRFLVPEVECLFVDRLQGIQRASVARDVGDFIIRRADGCFAYHLAVVVDDELQGVTDIVRGSDILPLTARHLLLQRALSFREPSYLHIPVVLSPEGAKLSKRDSAVALKATDARENLQRALQHLGIELPAGSDREPVSEIIKIAVGSWTKIR